MIELFYTLPQVLYVCCFSKVAQIKLRQLLKRCCKLIWILCKFFSKIMFSAKVFVSQSLRSRVVYKFARVLAILPATLVRPLTTFVPVSASTVCWTKLSRMFAGTCCHQGLVVTHVLQNLSRFLTAVSSFETEIMVRTHNFNFKWKFNLSDLSKAKRLRWLITVSSTFQEVDFDGSLLPLFITWWYNHGIKILLNHRWTRWYHFRDTIGYHSNTMTC